MAGAICLFFRFNLKEAWYQLSEEERKALGAKLQEGRDKVGAKMIVRCRSRWATDASPSAAGRTPPRGRRIVQVYRPGVRVQNSASPPVDCLVSGPAVKGGYAVAARFASLTLDGRTGDQDRLVIGEAEEERSANGAVSREAHPVGPPLRWFRRRTGRRTVSA